MLGPRHSRALHRLGLIALIVAASPVFPVLAQEWRGPVAIEVTVEDARGRDVAGAEVRLIFLDPAGSGALPSRLTDANGRADIAGLAAGRWTLEVRHAGHMTYRAEVSLAADRKPIVESAAQEMAPGATSTMRVKLNRGRSGAPPLALGQTAQTPRPPIAAAPAPPPPPVPAPEEAPVKQAIPAPATAPRPAEPAAVPTQPASPATQLSTAPVPPTAPSPKSTSPPPIPPPVQPPAVVVQTPAPAPMVPIAPVAPMAPIAPVTQAAISATPPPQVVPPAAAPAPAAPLRPAAAAVAPRQRLCVECSPGESAAWGEAAVEGGATSGCPADLAARLRSLDLGEAISVSALGDGCRVIRVDLPAGARYTGFRYEARSAGVTADCLPNRECPAGNARFPFEPVVRKESQRTTLLVAFESTAPDRRNALVAGYSTYNKK